MYIHIHIARTHHPFNDDLNKKSVIKTMDSDMHSHPSNKHSQT